MVQGKAMLARTIVLAAVAPHAAGAVEGVAPGPLGRPTGGDTLGRSVWRREERAYEMRISYGSSDLCSSDLAAMERAKEGMGVGSRHRRFPGEGGGVGGIVQPPARNRKRVGA